MNVYGGVEVKLRAFVTSALDGKNWLLYSPEKSPGTHWGVSQTPSQLYEGQCLACGRNRTSVFRKSSGALRDLAVTHGNVPTVF